MKDTSGPAFPVVILPNSTGEDGMSLRDYFAAQAMAGVCASQLDITPLVMAVWAYACADAMLKTRGNLVGEA